MGIGSKLNNLLNLRNRTVSDLSSAINVSPQTIYSIIKRDNTKVDLNVLQAIADELNVTLDYFSDRPLKSSNSDNTFKPKLTTKDERDIQKKLNSILDELEESEDTLMYDGEPMDDVTKELFRNCLENALKVAKLAAKEKYTPKKYRK